MFFGHITASTNEGNPCNVPYLCHHLRTETAKAVAVQVCRQPKIYSRYSSPPATNRIITPDGIGGTDSSLTERLRIPFAPLGRSGSNYTNYLYEGSYMLGIRIAYLMTNPSLVRNNVQPWCGECEIFLAPWIVLNAYVQWTIGTSCSIA